jgi:hypothetical protein
MRSKYRASSARSASGSVDSPSAVDPTTSQNKAVTTFRRPLDPSPNAAPHASQNFAATLFPCPQAGQTITAGD